MGDRMIDGPKLRAPKWWLGFALAWSRIVTGEQKRHARQARVEEGRAFQVPGRQMSARAPIVSRLTRVDKIDPFGRFGTIWSMKRVNVAEREEAANSNRIYRP